MPRKSATTDGWIDWLIYLIDEPPGGPDALLDVSDQSVAGL